MSPFTLGLFTVGLVMVVIDHVHRDVEAGVGRMKHKPRNFVHEEDRQLRAWYDNPPPGSRLIQLTQGYFAVVDEDDYVALSEFKWCVSIQRTSIYALRGVTIGGKSGTITMHRHLLQPDEDKTAIHRNDIGLDNRRENLAIVDSYTEVVAKARVGHGASKYRGVSWGPGTGLWRATIRANDETRYLGEFHTQKEAALAYNAAAKKYFGEFARFNKIPGVTAKDIAKEPCLKPRARSGYRGVSWNDHAQEYYVLIEHKKKSHYVGRFEDPIDAARAYDAKAVELGVPRWRLNFPEEHEGYDPR